VLTILIGNGPLTIFGQIPHFVNPNLSRGNLPGHSPLALVDGYAGWSRFKRKGDGVRFSVYSLDLIVMPVVDNRLDENGQESRWRVPCTNRDRSDRDAFPHSIKWHDLDR